MSGRPLDLVSRCATQYFITLLRADNMARHVKCAVPVLFSRSSNVPMHRPRRSDTATDLIGHLRLTPLPRRGTDACGALHGRMRAGYVYELAFRQFQISDTRAPGAPGSSPRGSTPRSAAGTDPAGSSSTSRSVGRCAPKPWSTKRS